MSRLSPDYGEWLARRCTIVLWVTGGAVALWVVLIIVAAIDR